MSEPEPSDQELFASYRASGDQAIRNAIVERHLSLGAALARRFDHRGVPLDDLVQVANIALIKAVERFDPAHGAAFTTFATPTVLGEIKRYFRDRTWAVRVTRGVKDLYIRVAPALGELQHALGRSPTVTELATHLGASEEDVLEAMEAGAAYVPDSVDSKTDADGPSIGDKLRDPGHEADEADTRLTVRALMARLPEREREIVFLRYFEDLSQSEIANRVGVSQVHVSRLLKRSLDRLGRRAGD